jgi:hypothetical protein
MKKLMITDVEFSWSVEPNTDRELDDAPWAWVVTVTATWRSFSGVDVCGGVSCNGEYFKLCVLPNMQIYALDDLNRNVSVAADDLEVLR